MTVYKSKIDWWLGAILAIAMAVSVIAALNALSTSPWQALLIGGPGFFLPLIALLATRYTIQDRQLIVQSGPIKWRIPIAEISEVTPTSDPIASPALSLDRLRIVYGPKKSLLVSPRNKEDFLKQIAMLRGSAV